MRWVEDVRFAARRLWSVRMSIIGVVWAGAGAYWLATPPEWKPTLSEPIKWALAIVGVSLAAAPGIAAVIDQPKLRADLGARKDERTAKQGES